MTADLHIHTVRSDGLLTPQTVVECAKSAGLRLIAVTDHDTTEACAELSTVAAQNGIKSVSGVEVSAYDKTVKFHTLAYGIDGEKFKPFLDELCKNSYLRAEDIIYKLSKVGVKITMEEVVAEKYSKTAPVHGMHIARAVLKKGYVKSVADFFREYVDGGAAFSSVGRPTPEETCEAIRFSGGLAVVAHPARIKMSERELKEKIERLIPCGLGGIEVYYTTHTKEQTAYYKNLAETLNLLKTGGSDTHVPGGGRAIGQPRFEPDAHLLKRLKID